MHTPNYNMTQPRFTSKFLHDDIDERCYEIQ